MSQSNLFSFSPEPGFTFCVGRDPDLNSNDQCSLGSKPVKHRFVRSKRKSLKIPSEYPSATPVAEKGNDCDNSKAPTSAVTGMIPCYFEGSSYSSKISLPCSTTEKSVKKEMEEKSEPKPSFTQIVAVSRFLKGIPQSPHFLPLKAYSNVAKQRLIYAWDTIFEETVDKLLSLQVDGFLADARRLWETMQELEKMGYNVLLLRRRLVELTDVLHRRRRHRNMIMRLKDKAEQHRLEKSRLEFEIVKLRAKAEAENASVEDIIAKVAKMEDEMPQFSADFTKLAIKLF